MSYLPPELLAHRITEILATADLNTITAKKVRRQLETEHNTDLNARKQEIDNLIMACLKNMQMGAAAAAAGMGGLAMPPQHPSTLSHQHAPQQYSSQPHQMQAHPQQPSFMLHQMPNFGQPGQRIQASPQQQQQQLSHHQHQNMLPMPVSCNGLPPPGIPGVFPHGLPQPGFPTNTTTPHNAMVAAFAQQHPMVLPPPMQSQYMLPPGASMPMLNTLSNGLPTSAHSTPVVTPTTPGPTSRRVALSSERVEEGGKAKKVSKKAKSRKKAPQNLDPNRVKRVTPLTKPMALSPDLSAVVGVPELGRAQVVQAIWVYIREKKLQDPNDKRFFTTDDKLRAVFNGLERLNCFEMNKYLSAHMSKIVLPEGAEPATPTALPVVSKPSSGNLSVSAVADAAAVAVELLGSPLTPGHPPMHHQHPTHHVQSIQTTAAGHPQLHHQQQLQQHQHQQYQQQQQQHHHHHQQQQHHHHPLSPTTPGDSLASPASAVADLQVAAAVAVAAGLPPTPIGELKTE